MSKQTIPVPDIGTTDAVEVIEISVKIGDAVNEGDTLIVLESSKASIEIPSSCTGNVIEIYIKVGDRVSTGKSILAIEKVGEKQEQIADGRRKEKIEKEEHDAGDMHTDLGFTAEAIDTIAVRSEDIPSSEIEKLVEVNGKQSSEVESQFEGVHKYQFGDNVYAGPSVRKLAREMGIALNEIEGSGSKGRIQKEDVTNYVKRFMEDRSGNISRIGVPAASDIDFAQFGSVDIQPLSKLHRLTAANLHRSWLNLPHVTQFDEVDITDLENFRESLKAEAAMRRIKISPLPFIAKACAIALKAYPKFNASLKSDGKYMVIKHFVNIGMAVDTPEGLVVPVLRDVDNKSILELAMMIAEIKQNARDKKLKIADFQGACFTISNLGAIGGTGFTPLINAPEVAILGVSRFVVKPVWSGKEFEPHKMLPLSLSYDHRVVNGADAGRFFAFLNELLADVRRLVL